MEETRDELIAEFTTGFPETDSLGSEPLNKWLNDAIRQYSLKSPHYSSTEVSSVAEEKEYDFPNGARTLFRIVDETDSDVDLDFELAGRKFYLDHSLPSGHTLKLFYSTLHASLPENSSTTTVPQTDKTILESYFRYRVFEYTAKSFLESVGFVDPDASEANIDLAEFYLERAQDELKEFRKYLESSGTITG